MCERTEMPDCLRNQCSSAFQLVAACSWMAPEVLQPLQKEKIQTLVSGVEDWQAFQMLVHRHRVPAVVYRVLQWNQIHGVPEEVESWLRSEADHARFQAMQQVSEWLRLLPKFASAGISVFPLKGGPLSQQLWGDPTLRHSKDLDLLVHPVDLLRSEALLLEAGYKLIDLGFERTPKRWRAYQGLSHHLGFLHRSGVVVELHWRFEVWDEARFEAIKAHTESRVWMGVVCQVLRDEAQLLLLCAHGARHIWFRMKWLSDVAMLISKNPALNWKKIGEMASAWGIEPHLRQTLLLLEWVYGPLTRNMHGLDNRKTRAHGLAKDAMKRLLAEEPIPSYVESLKRFVYGLRLQPSAWRVVFQRFWLSVRDFESCPIPDRFFWMYRPLRPCLILWRCLCGSTKIYSFF